MNIEKEYNQLKESAKLAADASFKLSEQVYNLKAENERLKSQIKDLQIRKDRYYLKGLEQERQISDYITILQDIKAIAEVGLDKYHNGLILAKPIIDLIINKAEEE